MQSDPWLWLLQANDTAYPSGSYAHSYGLEECVEAGIVQKPEDLEKFLLHQVCPALLTFELPYFARVYTAVQAEDLEALCELNDELDAWRLPAELKDASRRVGSQRLELLSQLQPSELILRYRGKKPRSHHLIVTALELSALPMAQAARAFAFQNIASLVSSSMKLIRIGQTSCQQISLRVFSQLGSQIDRALTQPVDGWFNPLLEIASLRHARAHARLFIS